MSTFGQINLVVKDIAASIDFYRLLEVDISDSFEWPEGSGAEHVEARSDGGCHMALDNHQMAQVWNGRFDPDRNGGNVVIGLMVANREDVDRLFAKARDAGHPVGQEPYDAFFGSRYAIVIDPDGNQVGLKSPIDESRKYLPEL